MAVAGPLPRGGEREPAFAVSARAVPDLAVSAAVLAAAALAVVHTAGVRLFAHEQWPGATPELDLPVWVGLASGGGLLAGVCAAWTCRLLRPVAALGTATAVGAAALPVWASWTGPPTGVRTAVLAAPAVLAAGLAQVVPGWTPGRSRLGLLAWLSGAVAVGVHVLGYDPFADVHCSRVCRSTGGPWVDGITADVVRLEGVLVLVTGAVGVTAVVRGRGVPAGIRAASGVALATVGVAAVVDLAWRDTTAWARTTTAWLPLVLWPVAGAVCVASFRAASQRRDLDALVRALEHGPVAGVHFAVPGEGRWVDATGRPVPADAPGVVVRDHDGPAVRLSSLRAGDETAQLPSSRLLALTNARLTALAAARVEDVRAAQRSAVHRTDVERHRIQRDLHDGAQQSLVSAALHLSAAVTRTGATPTLLDAQQQVSDALARLRDLVRGPVPTSVLDDGITAALEDLAADAAVPVALTVRGSGATPPEVAVAAYLCAAALVDSHDAERAPTEACRIELSLGEAGVRLVGTGRSTSSDVLGVDLLDRVGALAGSVTTRTDGHLRTTEVWIPCGS
jgi:signal transduction histidine kinase